MLLVTLLAAPFLIAQQPEEAKPAPPPTLVYEGKPLKTPLACSQEDIDAFGLTCSEDAPCEVYLELSAVEAVGSKLFLTGNLHTESATLFSLLLMSEDSGKTWVEAHERLRSTGLEQIQFIDFETGWISGQTLVALPRNPFLLRTSDGGKSWRQIPVSSESRVGAIEKFHFENKTAGELLMDRTQSGESGGRHEYYETNTGGDSWSLREVSPQPLKMKRSRPANAAWRVRADGVTKSFRVEKRNGAKWDTVSAFLIHAGECRPGEWKLAEPPAEPITPSVESISVGPPGGGRKAPPSLKKKK